MPHNLKTSASFSFHGGQQQPRCGPVPVAMQWFMTSSNAWCEAVAPHCNVLQHAALLHGTEGEAARTNAAALYKYGDGVSSRPPRVARVEPQ